VPRSLSRPRGAHGPVLRVSAIPPEEFGPTAGAQAVRDAATTQAVTSAGWGSFTTLSPANTAAENQTLIDDDATGRIWWPKGTGAGYSPSTSGFSIKPGQEHRLESIAGRTRTSSDSAIITPTGNYGFQTPGAGGAPIILRGGVITGADLYGLVVNNNPGFVMTDTICELGNTGILIQYSSTIQRCIFRDNTNKGIGASSSWTTLVLENIEIDNNNTSQTAPDVDSSGCKILLSGGAGTESLTVQGIWAHDNYGRGFWCDSMHAGSVLIEESVFENNAWNGFMYEESWGTSIARRLYVTGNCWETGVGAGNWNRMCQVLYSRSNGNDGGGGGHGFSNNWIVGTGDTAPIALIDNLPSNREMSAFNAHDNDIYFDSTFHERIGGKFGPGEDIPNSELYIADNNIFDFNTYHAPDTSLAYWVWGTPGGDSQTELTFAQWQAFSQDVNSTFEVI